MIPAIALLLLSAGLDTARPQPAIYLDSALVNLSKNLINVSDIQSLFVDNKQVDAVRHTQGAVYIQLKPGTNVFLTLDQVTQRQPVDIQGLPAIYFIDGKPLKDTIGVRIQADNVGSVEITKTNLPKLTQSIALVMIETAAAAKPKPGDKNLILRGVSYP